MKIHQEICAGSQTIIQTNFERECFQELKVSQKGFRMSGSFDKLKELCTTTCILAYANFGKPFKLHTDVSVLGLGAVLYQVQDGAEKVISYASQSLTKSKTKYPVHKLELLCLKWAITDQFHKYLYGNTFNVYTVNNPLT